eukprot:362632-Chlamydomonas_euryale.AAC.7
MPPSPTGTYVLKVHSTRSFQHQCAFVPSPLQVLELNASAVLGSDVTISGPEPSDVPDRSMSLMISYLRSYSGYGIVALSCGPGCTCNPSR